MGSITTLSIGKLEVDWGKNFFHINHSPLFVKGDLKELDRECFETYSDEVIIEKHKVLSAPLKNILPRLELPVSQQITLSTSAFVRPFFSAFAT